MEFDPPLLFFAHSLDSQSLLIVVLRPVESMATEEDGFMISGTSIILILLNIYVYEILDIPRISRNILT